MLLRFRRFHYLKLTKPKQPKQPKQLKKPVSMTTILAIDCATGPCSVAVWDGQTIAAYVENLKPVMQSASLIPMVEDALKQSGMTYKDIGLVAATVGPGSFTGIRVGLAAAQGIAYAAKIPSKGFTTLEVLVFAADPNATTLAILQAGKGEWYYQYFAPSPHPKPLSEPKVGVLELAVAEAPSATITVSGNASTSFASCGVTFPRADALARLAATSHAYQELRPFYIRPPDAKLPTGRRI